MTSTTILPVLVSADDHQVTPDVVLDRIASWCAARRGDMDRLGVNRRILCRRAAQNLDCRIDGVGIHGQPPALMLNFEGLESGLLLADEFWESLATSIPGDRWSECRPGMS